MIGCSPSEVAPRICGDTKLGCGGQNPFGQQLSEQQRGMILAWIRHGASTD
jgi:hypothetical protein